jgi:hypothetical protein
VGTAHQDPLQRTRRGPSSKPAPSIAWPRNAGNSIEIHLHATLPYKRQRVKKLSARHTNYTTVYFALTGEQAKKLREAARQALVTESDALRRMLDASLAEVDKRGLPSEPYGKMRFLGYEQRVVPRTIRREQDAKLRELSERTGRSISELLREAMEKHL